MDRLPPEILLSIFELLVIPADAPCANVGLGPPQLSSMSLRAPTSRRAQANLVQLAASHSSFTWPALAALYGTAPCITSLQSMGELASMLSVRRRTNPRRRSGLLRKDEHCATNMRPDRDLGVCHDDDVDWSSSIRSLYIVCLRTNEKYWGPAIARLLSLVPNLRKLVLHKIDDLRSKQILSSGLQSIASITHLTVRNIGLPPPSTQIAAMISACSSTIEHLELAYLRDLDQTQFAQLLFILADDCPRLNSLDLDGLSRAQAQTLFFPSSVVLPGQKYGDIPMLPLLPTAARSRHPSQDCRRSRIGEIIAGVIAKRFDRRLLVKIFDRPDADRVQMDFDSLWLRSDNSANLANGEHVSTSHQSRRLHT
ncbi:BQ2448_5587 [Microbotryum intermedium]|uniref:BQ2448_5587 protein n=1 Tax=Microbotryum intermedium TaxID=269621 RepID=A0A238F4L0_9BASI|nr:BQ2448_5587 [Microbotryum intermedium]